jgi:hypothetical protein
MVFLLVKYLYDSYTGIIASASFAILSVSPSVLGTSAHATHFVILPALGGIFLVLKGIDCGKAWHLLWGGMLLGLAFLMKQPGIFFIIFAFSYLLFCLFRKENASFCHLLKQGGVFLFGAVMPFGVVCLILYLAGVFDKFWFWTFSYAYQYGSRIPLSRGIEIFLNQAAQVVDQSYLLWVIAGVGLGALFWDATMRTRAAFVIGFFVFSFLAVCPGLYFREHYFVLILPVASLFTGMGLSSFRKLLLRLQPKLSAVPSILFLVLILFVVFQYRSFFFEMTTFQACRAMYGLNPFPESVEISKYIRANSKKGDKIAVLGSEPQIYFYSDRHSATGHIYTYALMEGQKYAFRMQREMIEEIEKAQPEYLVFVNIPTSWLVKPDSERYIFNWFSGYSKKNFSLVGVVEILSNMRTEYRWDNEAADYSPRSPYFLCVYKRKNI